MDNADQETPVQDTALPGLPLTRECPYHPPRAYEDLRDRGSVTRIRLYDGREIWAVTGHGVVRSLLADERLTVDRDKAEFPKLARLLVLGRPDRHPSMRALLRTDPPLHTEQRRALSPSLSLKRIQTWRPALEAVADERLEALAAGPRGAAADLVGSYVRPLVTASMTEMLGIPEDDRSRLDDALYGHFDRVPVLEDYLRSVYERKLDQPADGSGLLDDLIAQVRAGTLTPEQFVHYGTVLIVAGQDVTVSTIALAVLTLLTHEDELARLLGGEVPWSDAVEELLRFLSLTGGIVRVATTDIETSGVVIRAGDGVVLLNAAANRDPGVYELPRELDLRRRVRNHLAFGFGVHQCVGQNLARLDVEVALRKLFDRFPKLRLAVPLDEVPVRQGLVFGVSALPVEW
ncbi:cytochrome P450 [Streptomyces sp. NBC_01210]|uniref:cytochrome P450 n=1 Tax=Streptomyces sp. NBC_01210 TaxID=2903774 RepID=UPI002E0E2B81|nr:cytochrome P450 [Streptomyces sp. NBC_01210]